MKCYFKHISIFSKISYLLVIEYFNIVKHKKLVSIFYSSLLKIKNYFSRYSDIADYGVYENCSFNMFIKMLTLNLSLKNYDRKPSILSDMFSNN